MKILAVETSCDDTGIAILNILGDKKSPNFKILSNVIASQVEIGKKYGGVYPMMAKREHQRNLVPVLIKALKESKLLKISSSEFQNSKLEILNSILEREPELYKELIPFLKKFEKPDVDLIAVTNGPGLEPCLWVGVNFAKALSSFWDIQVVTVNHVESHILVNFLQTTNYPLQTIFPAIALVVSGGHTQLILVKKIGSYKILGETRDDAAGECFDKCAKILGLGYPGGPIISKLAEKAVLGPTSPKLPRPMFNTKDYDFSFSGLKTAVLYHHRKQDKEIKKNKQYIADMCAEIQQAIIDVLIRKTIKATKDYKAKTIILGGGVTANHELKTQLFIKIKEDLPNTKFLFPEIDHSTDNGLMTAIAGFYHKKSARSDLALFRADANLRISK